MRILVTGSSGFIGRTVVRRLQEQGKHETYCLDRQNIPAAAEWKPEAVIHCAWGGVSHEFRDDDALQSGGLLLTQTVACAVAGTCRRFVGIGSQAELSQPEIPYSQYKALTNRYLQRFCKERNISWAWARLYSVYGPGDNPWTFIPYLIRALLRGDTEIPLTDQNIPWDWLYVDDAADALIRLAEVNINGEFELGYGASVLTQDTARAIRDKINPEAKLLFGLRPKRVKEIPGLLCDIEAIQRATGWWPQVPISKGLDRTIAWYRQHIR